MPSQALQHATVVVHVITLLSDRQESLWAVYHSRDIFELLYYVFIKIHFRGDIVLFTAVTDKYFKYHQLMLQLQPSGMKDTLGLTRPWPTATLKWCLCLTECNSNYTSASSHSHTLDLYVSTSQQNILKLLGFCLDQNYQNTSFNSDYLKLGTVLHNVLNVKLTVDDKAVEKNFRAVHGEKTSCIFHTLFSPCCSQDSKS